MTFSVLANAAFRGVRWALLSALVLDIAAACPAQAPGAAAQPASQTALSAAAPEKAAPQVPAALSAAHAEPAPKGNHEGIKVHGHWTVEVRNPDGKVVSHSEFENSLAPVTGPFALVNLVAGTYTSAGIGIGVDLNSDPFALFSFNQTTSGGVIYTGAAAVQGNISTEPGPCTGGENGTQQPDASNGCLIIPPVSDLTPPSYIATSGFIFPNLVVAAAPLQSNGFPPSSQLMLSGSILTTAAGTINDVETIFFVVNSCATPPTACTPALATSSGALSLLTEATLNGENGLPNALTVTSGQLIAITVVISFS
jgi:hypothetical protein